MLKKYFINNYNIEFCHIYTNENISNEHILAIDTLKKVIKNLKGSTYVTTVMIDNYNPTENLLNVDQFINELEKRGAKPDFLAFEADLERLKHLLLDKMTGEVKKKYEKYIEKHSKCPCSFLVAIWHLIRLGLLPEKGIIKKKVFKPFKAEKIITILPERYSSVEEKAKEIIFSTEYKSIVEDKLIYEYY